MLPLEYNHNNFHKTQMVVGPMFILRIIHESSKKVDSYMLGHKANNKMKRKSTLQSIF